MTESTLSRNKALQFVVLLGIVSLFADITYEGARSITGPYLAVLGASATTVSFVAGLGELIGYGFRLASGYLSDKTRQYWTITILGYVINLMAVPLLALVGHWELAACLMVLERLGKALRSPARDAMLSHATQTLGHGWGFGLHEAMDQTGALLGPLIVALVLYLKGGFQVGFAILAIPAILAITTLIIAWLLYPHPEHLEVTVLKPETEGLSRTFWIYSGAVMLIAAGYADFPLIAFHFQKAEAMPETWIPVLYALAMAVDAVAALFLGRLFDRKGIIALIIATVFSTLFPLLVFYGGLSGALLGMVCWGVGMGAQESVVKAAIAQMVSSDRRGAAFGIFQLGVGVAWFLGSALMGVLYDTSLFALVAFSMLVQLCAILLLCRTGENGIIGV